jgi:hypothetical protein
MEWKVGTSDTDCAGKKMRANQALGIYSTSLRYLRMGWTSGDYLEVHVATTQYFLKMPFALFGRMVFLSNRCPSASNCRR